MVFRGGDEGDDDEIRGETEAQKKVRLIEEKKIKEDERRWGWFAFIHNLAEGKALDFERIVKLPLRFCLDLLTYNLIQQDKERKRLELQKAQR